MTERISTRNKTLKYAAATSVVATAASAAHAAIITNDDLGASGFVVTTENFAWNIDNTGPAEGSFHAFSATGASTFGWLDLYGYNGFQAAVSGGRLLNLAYGANVSAAPAFEQYLLGVFLNGNFAFAQGFTSGETGYIGFQFDPTGTQTLFGWAEVILTEQGLTGRFEVVRWAYEDSGSAITVGAIPEPKTAALGLGALALGAAGLRRWRKAKADRQAS